MRLKYFEFAEEVLDEMAPFVDFRVNEKGLCASWMLRNGNKSPAFIHVFNDPVGIKGLVGDEAVECDALDQWSKANRVTTLARQKDKPHQIAKGIRHGEDFGRPAAFRLADGLILSPPFAPCPWRWTLTMVASTTAYSMSGSSDRASNNLLKTSAFTQSL